MNLFRLLRADEIECRIGTINAKGLSLLLYKDARCDMNVLDDTVGPMNWKKFYTRDNRNCTVEIFDKSKGQWIGKEDTGTESNTESEKGLASDSFKRACVNWGIGRELYSAPFIWIGSDQCEIKADGTKYRCYDRFEVAKIGYDALERICSLTIEKVKGKTRTTVFTWANPTLTVTMVKTLAKVAEDHGYEEHDICNHFGVNKYRELTIEQYMKLMDSMGEAG